MAEDNTRLFVKEEVVETNSRVTPKILELMEDNNATDPVLYSKPADVEIF